MSKRNKNGKLSDHFVIDVGQFFDDVKMRQDDVKMRQLNYDVVFMTSSCNATVAIHKDLQL